MEEYTKPNYQKIYTDIIIRKHPDKEENCRAILNKKDISVLDVITLNKIIFTTDGVSDKSSSNQKHRSYDKETILQILKYQKEYKLNNIELARYFKLSRNSIKKWKELF